MFSDRNCEARETIAKHISAYHLNKDLKPKAIWTSQNYF